ncbi:MAG TPA: hypothetical protein VGG13_02885 [Candidatus Saccharimonadales bacterium]|jgi:hypothetical protein
MNSVKRREPAELRQELRAAGARDSEVDELLPIAINLQALPESEFREKTSRWKIPLLASSTALAGLIVGTILVAFSQAALPGSLFYAIQKISDNAAVALHPSYRGTVMMKRADQVKQLVVEHAGQSAVLEALADYQSEAAVYKYRATNYALFDYCKADLQQAADKTAGPERTAINKTLASLQNV